MADRKISDLTALTTPASGDYLPIVDISESAAASKNKRITIEELMRGMPDGTAAAPGIAFETDPNTGIYSPGADQLAVATNGQGRLFVDANGNVGVGTNDTANAFVTLTKQDASLRLDPLTGAASIVAVQTGVAFRDLTIASNETIFQTAATERLRIDSSGRVGIGTSSPASILDVAGDVSITGNENYLYLYSTYIVGSNSRVRMRAVGAGGGSGFGGDFRLSTRKSDNTWNTDAFVVNSSGRVGIGTASPTTLLDVNADTVRVRTARTPASASATGATGEICWDASYIYVCTATDTWKRAALSTW